MSTAYGTPAKYNPDAPRVDLSLPWRDVLPNVGPVILCRMESQHIPVVRDILNFEIEQGNSYPQENPLSTEEFCNYFLSHEAFVLCHDVMQRDVIGAFYVKPNFPGRASHVCNGGFLVAVSQRNKGVGKYLAASFLRIAKLLGYRASFFNLVFGNNPASLRLWRSSGFTETGVVPNCLRLKDGTYTTAHQFYHDLSN
ncbi:acyl-CoA N-acyltransferase [Pelomyxa schiedti]|nr:acyl-CoA N-acyltransferase [Pelomyxa schiedti]